MEQLTAKCYEQYTIDNEWNWLNKLSEWFDKASKPALMILLLMIQITITGRMF